MSFLSVIFLLTCSCDNRPAERSKLNKNNITGIIKAMTLHEKAMLVTGTGMDIPLSMLENLPRAKTRLALLPEKAKSLTLNMMQWLRK
jgi:hypothetical protein